MIRNIISRKDLITNDNSDTVLIGGERVNVSDVKPDKYLDRILKLIPAEIISVYLTLDTIVKSSDKLYLHWVVFVFCLFACFFYQKKIMKITKYSQFVLTLIGFCIWVYALGGPFLHSSLYEPVIASLLLPSFTFILPFWEL